MSAILETRGLKTWLDTASGPVRALDGVDLYIAPGETLALVGESGSGKSVTALSIARLLPDNGYIVAGEVNFKGQNLLDLPERQMRNMRGRRIAMIFQEPATSLNPVLTIGQQIVEAVERHTPLRGAAARKRAVELLDQVGIADSGRRVGEYPFQLSGGMKQRAMIALALAAEPDVLIADEPTTALDVTIQAQVLELLKNLQRERGMAMLLITHDLGIVAGMADRVAVIYAGQIIETATREAFFRAPQHPYSQKLFAALPGSNRRGEPLAMIKGQVPRLDKEFIGCRFADRCDYAWERCVRETPGWTATSETQLVRCHLREEQGPAPDQAQTLREAMVAPTRQAIGPPLLEVRDLKVHFPIRKGLFKRQVGAVKAVDGVSLSVAPGKTLSLVGESGCGKTTVGKAILQLLQPTEGSIWFDGIEFSALRGEALRRRRSEVQIVFQDPYASLNPRMRIGETLREGIQALDVLKGKAIDTRVAELLDQVGLPADALSRYPHEFSGGQRQRIAIARALAVNPKLIVCDEPTSALDVSVQAQILNLLEGLQRELGLSYLFITHNLAVVEYLADEVAVMYLGRIVERGRADEVLQNPVHPYTRALLAAVPTLDGKRAVLSTNGDIPSPSAPPSGCHFHPRCPNAFEKCPREYPPAFSISETQNTNCWLYELPAARTFAADAGAIKQAMKP